MNHIRGWETSDELMTVSMCGEGCLHLRIGRTIIKLTRDEFYSLTKLAKTVTQDIQRPDLGLAQGAPSGH
jgi:hypothetical protein